MRQLRAGILGATGAVGQRLVQLLDGHPWFRATELIASERSSGRKYRDAVLWRLSEGMPAQAGDLLVRELSDNLDCDLVFSALDSSVAGEAEASLAAAGVPVISNSSSHRMDEDVPLLIPEVNWEHAGILGHQRSSRHYTSGLLATNPNCSTIGLALALKPIHDAFGVAEVTVVTMQALSGAGINGIAAMSIMDNVIPYVAGEEEKIESESLKILGSIKNDRFLPADIRVSAQCNRVAVLDGHTEAVSVRLQTPATAEQLRHVLARFTSEPQKLQLPTAPTNPILLLEGNDRPQPQLDRDRARGMAVSVGHIRPCPVLDWKFTLVVHNSIRGAAGAALLNAELLVAQGYIA